jgi:hypothetical protein
MECPALARSQISAKPYVSILASCRVLRFVNRDSEIGLEMGFEGDW